MRRRDVDVVDDNDSEAADAPPIAPSALTLSLLLQRALTTPTAAAAISSAALAESLRALGGASELDADADAAAADAGVDAPAPSSAELSEMRALLLRRSLGGPDIVVRHRHASASASAMTSSRAASTASTALTSKEAEDVRRGALFVVCFSALVVTALARRRANVDAGLTRASLRFVLGSSKRRVCGSVVRLLTSMRARSSVLNVCAPWSLVAWRRL